MGGNVGVTAHITQGRQAGIRARYPRPAEAAGLGYVDLFDRRGGESFPGREPFENQGRLTELMRSGKLFSDIGLPPINPQDDRAMICGSPSMLDETSQVLDSFGLSVSPRMGDPGHYLIERAFVEK